MGEFWPDMEVLEPSPAALFKSGGRAAEPISGRPSPGNLAEVRRSSGAEAMIANDLASRANAGSR